MPAYESTVKPYKGLGMEGGIAKWYAKLTKKSLDDYKALARRVAGEISPGSSVLEIAPGPGYFAIELAKLGAFQITGLDISETFVEIARANAANARVQIDFRRGNASDMPFGDELFDFLVCCAAFKNFTEPLAALHEMYRVLKPGGRALIIDLRRNAPMEAIDQVVNRMRVGVVNGVITKLTLRFLLVKRAYTKSGFESLVSATKFDNADIREDLISLDVLLSKDRASA